MPEGKGAMARAAPTTCQRKKAFGDAFARRGQSKPRQRFPPHAACPASAEAALGDAILDEIRYGDGAGEATVAAEVSPARQG
jgi:hypothetical protein